MARNPTRTKVRTLYNEKYVTRACPVTAEEAAKVLSESSVIYAVEQGTIEIPSYENQQRSICVLRFERIIAPKPVPEAPANGR